MLLSTPITPLTPPFQLLLDTPLLLLGSCFSDEGAARLQQAGLDVMGNPFGTLFNPTSIASLLLRSLENRPISDEELVFRDGLWHSWLHHSSFSAADRVTCLEGCNTSIHQVHEALLRPGMVLVLTFGTAYVYALRDAHWQQGACPTAEGLPVVANCHKLPPDTFLRQRLSVDEVVAIWKPLLGTLCARGIRVIFTVSPIRHMADGAHENQLSKSTLLLAVEQLLDLYPRQSCYFPAYELLLDELRDYRFFARDLCHPSDVAADIIWERFTQTFFSPSHQHQLLLNQKHHRQTQHVPFRVNSEL